MLKTPLPSLLCLLLASAGFAAAPPARPMGSDALAGLVGQLGHRDFRAREQAERQLQAQGAAALPHLRKGLGHADAEVRRRSLRLLAASEHTLLVAPRRLTLSISTKPIAVVLEEMSKATGYKILTFNNGFMPFRPAGGPVQEAVYSYRFLNTPFWEAMDRVCRDANLVIQQSWGDESIRVQSAGGHTTHTGFDGAFRYAAASFQMYRNVDLGTVSPRGNLPTRSETLTLNFNLFAEPRLPFLNVGEVRLDAAYDNERNSMLLKAEPDATEGPFNPFVGRVMRRRFSSGGGHKQTSAAVSVALSRPSEKATTVKQLRGVVPVTLLVEQKPVVLSDKILSAKNVKKTVGDLEFNIDSAQKTPNNQVQVKFSVTNKGNGSDYTWMNTLHQRIELQDDKGVKFQNWGSSWSSGGNTATVTLTFGHNGVGPAPTPSRFVYQHWITRQHEVAFTFKDLPLP